MATDPIDAARLAKKLNLGTVEHALLLDAPSCVGPLMTLLEEGHGVAIDLEPRPTVTYDYVHAFVLTAERAAELLPIAADAVRPGGLLWISYPKKASKRYDSDLSRDSDAWSPLYDRDVEPVSQVSVDEDWSALRFRPVSEIGSFKRGFARSAAGKRRVGS